MSNNQVQQHKKGGPAAGEIKHTNFLSEHIGALYLNSNYSDIVITVEDEEFHAHKVILAARSDYFRALLFGGMRESSQNKIVIKDTGVDAFKMLLRYIYTGMLTLNNVKEDLILEILGLAHQYGFTDLETAISDFLRQALTIQNCCLIYDSARLYHLRFLMQVSAAFIDKHVSKVIAHESFPQLSLESVKALVSRDSFFAPEIDIFDAVCQWISANSDVSKEGQASVLSAVRLPRMTIIELLKFVRPTGLISPDTILDAVEVQSISNSSHISHRGLLQPEVNVASPQQGSAVLQGEMKSALLDGNAHNYDMERGYTRHCIGSADDPGILIKLGTQCIVNHVKLLLWDKDLRSYSYYIEVSIDQKDWTRVVDYTQYYCRSWQYLYFEPRVVRFVRIVGTNNTVNKVFHVVCFEIMYTSKPFTLDKGLIVPKHNVATNSLSASVIEGVSRTRNSLLDGNTQFYDWESGYTCHQLGSGCILIQLGQPYLIDSMRMLLWDCDDRLYSYYIEVSVNMWDWDMIVDKSHEQCTSWQTLYFEKRPVVFIRITGTQNTANEVFHLVHFECPAQIEDPHSAGKSTKTSETNTAANEVEVKTQSGNSTDVEINTATTAASSNSPAATRRHRPYVFASTI